jgi:hypothetical protein
MMETKIPLDQAREEVRRRLRPGNALEGADAAWSDGIGAERSEMRAVVGQKVSDVRRRLAGITGRVWARTMDKAPEEIE